MSLHDRGRAAAWAQPFISRPHSRCKDEMGTGRRRRHWHQLEVRHCSCWRRGSSRRCLWAPLVRHTGQLRRSGASLVSQTPGRAAWAARCIGHLRSAAESAPTARIGCRQWPVLRAGCTPWQEAPSDAPPTRIANCPCRANISRLQHGDHQGCSGEWRVRNRPCAPVSHFQQGACCEQCTDAITGTPRFQQPSDRHNSRGWPLLLRCWALGGLLAACSARESIGCAAAALTRPRHVPPPLRHRTAPFARCIPSSNLAGVSGLPHRPKIGLLQAAGAAADAERAGGPPWGGVCSCMFRLGHCAASCWGDKHPTTAADSPLLALCCQPHAGQAQAAAAAHAAQRAHLCAGGAGAALHAAVARRPPVRLHSHRRRLHRRLHHRLAGRLPGAAGGPTRGWRAHVDSLRVVAVQLGFRRRIHARASRSPNFPPGQQRTNRCHPPPPPLPARR